MLRNAFSKLKMHRNKILYAGHFYIQLIKKYFCKYILHTHIRKFLDTLAARYQRNSNTLFLSAILVKTIPCSVVQVISELT